MHLNAQAPACTGPRDNQVRVRMINGHEARLQHWPGQAAFIKAPKGESRSLATHFCGGTVISPNWVLTAAHCLEDFCEGAHCPISRQGYLTNYRSYGDLYEIEIVLGTSNLERIDKSNIRRISKIILREDYTNAPKGGRDVALIKLDHPWNNGPFARLSASLKTDPSPDLNNRVMVAGFGLKDPDIRSLKRFTRADGSSFNAGSSKLEEVLVPIVPENVCKKRYSGLHVSNGQLCAGYEAGRYDACSGDSGGQMVAFDKNGCPYQVGIVSWGKGCAAPKNYGIYTRVSHHAKWIRGHVGQINTIKESQLTAANLPELQRTLATSSISDLQQLLNRTNDKVRLTFPDGPRIKLGQTYSFQVESSIAGRLIMFDINTKGVITQLFPNSYLRNRQQELIGKGETLLVPGGPDYGFDGFKAILPTGKGQVVALVVPEGFARTVTAPETRKSRGFKIKPREEIVAEPAPMSYLVNLIDQIRQTTRNFSNENMDKIAISVTNYEIVR